MIGGDIITKFKLINNKTVSVKKNLIIFMICIIVVTISLYLSKSYAVYKLQKDVDVIKSQIGTFKLGDYSVAVLVDGKETDTFPSYEDNYKVESVDCTNGVTATFDVENWRLAIDDMSSTSCKCTVSFNSKETNTTTPIAYSKKELIAMNDEIKSISAKELANYLYPVGSVYMSTEDDTVDKVQTKFGGTWVKYASGTTLLSVDDDHEINSTGGASSVKLSTGNIPSLSVSGTTDKTGSGYTISNTSSSRTVSSWTGSHLHNGLTITGISTGAWNGSDSNSIGLNYSHNTKGSSINTAYASITVSGQTVSDYYANKITGVESHNHSFTGNYTNSSQTDVDIQNPYTAVYMYKRTA